jgi:hypothetical protein
MKFKVYDEDKSLLEEFDTYEAAAKYVYNNNDIASFINDERVTEEVHVPVETAQAAPISQQSGNSRLLTASEALKRLESFLSSQVSDIITSVIENQGQLYVDARLHVLVFKKLRELGYDVSTEDSASTRLVSIPMDVENDPI